MLKEAELPTQRDELGQAGLSTEMMPNPLEEKAPLTVIAEGSRAAGPAPIRMTPLPRRHRGEVRGQMARGGVGWSLVGRGVRDGPAMESPHSKQMQRRKRERLLHGRSGNCQMVDYSIAVELRSDGAALSPVSGGV